jgi:rubredoxin
MAKWKRTVRNYIYDEEEGERFENLSSSWVRPVCGALKSAFVRIGREKPEELDKALEQATKSDKPAIVDVVVDPKKIAPIIKVASED